MGSGIRSEVTLFRRSRSILAESIWWDGEVRWCDIDAGLVYRGALSEQVESESDEVRSFPPPVTAFQPLARGGGFVFSGVDFVAVAGGSGEIRKVLARIDHGSPRIRFNEGKCDPAGRFVVGSMNLDHQPDCAIYSVDEQGSLKTLVGGIGVANGFEWSPDGRRMWFTDTATQTIYSSDYSVDGELTNVEEFASGQMSDGLAMDAEGGFWNGIYDRGVVAHWTRYGVLDFEFDVPAVHVTSVGFGGPDLSTLFIATVRENCTEEQLEKQPLSGSIFQVDTSTHGYPTRTFGS